MAAYSLVEEPVTLGTIEGLYPFAELMSSAKSDRFISAFRDTRQGLHSGKRGLALWGQARMAWEVAQLGKDSLQGMARLLKPGSHFQFETDDATLSRIRQAMEPTTLVRGGPFKKATSIDDSEFIWTLKRHRGIRECVAAELGIMLQTFHKTLDARLKDPNFVSALCLEVGGDFTFDSGALRHRNPTVEHLDEEIRYIMGYVLWRGATLALEGRRLTEDMLDKFDKMAKEKDLLNLRYTGIYDPPVILEHRLQELLVQLRHKLRASQN